MKFLKAFALALALGLPAAVLAKTTIEVTPSLPAGRYDRPIYVKLEASEPTAKIWYTCKRNGTPSDLSKYEGPILLSKSCALVYFAYVNAETESKILRTDYTIFYSDDIKLETDEDILSLRNTGNNTVDVGGWSVIAGTGSIAIPAGTYMPPGDKYVIGKVEPNSYSLTSPEWYMKSEIAIAPEKPKTLATTIPKKRPTVTPKPTESVQTGSSVPASDTPKLATGAITLATANTTESEKAPESSQPTSNLKASVTESGSNNNTAAIVAIMLLFLSIFIAKLRKK